MRKMIMLAILLVSVPLLAEEPSSPAASASPSPVPRVIQKWNVSTVPWDAWFKVNAIVTEKPDHIHFFWNAEDFKANFEGKEKNRRLAEAAVQLVARLYPEGAQKDLAKVDIVYVLKRDFYGNPVWDSLKQVAHFEFLRSKVLKLAKAKREPSESDLQKAFEKFEIF